MGCHRNHAISHSLNQNYFEDTFISYPGGPNEQFGTHEKLSWGVQGNLNWMPEYFSKAVIISILTRVLALTMQFEYTRCIAIYTLLYVARQMCL